MSKRIYPVTVENGELVESNEKLTVNGLPIAKDGTIDSSYVSGSGSSEWEVDANGDLVPVDGEPVSVGSLSSDELFSAEPNVNYGNPQWIGRTAAQISNMQFESIDGYYKSTSGSASITVTHDGMKLSTGTTSGSTAEARKFIAQIAGEADFGKDISYESATQFNGTIGNRTEYHTNGRVHAGNEGFGFKVSAGDLLGVVHNGTSETTATLISGFSTGAKMLRAEHLAGSKVEYYVNGTKQGEITSGLPTSANYLPGEASFYVKNSAAEDETTIVRQVKRVQKP